MAAYRRRPDGILEIVPPQRPSTVRSAVAGLGALLSVTLVPLVALGVFVSVGMPVVVVAVLAIAGTMVWLSARRPQPASEEPGVLRLAHAGSRTAASRSRAP